jgi:hypothetical protein
LDFTAMPLNLRSRHLAEFGGNGESVDSGQVDRRLRVFGYAARRGSGNAARIAGASSGSDVSSTGILIEHAPMRRFGQILKSSAAAGHGQFDTTQAAALSRQFGGFGERNRRVSMSEKRRERKDAG